VNGASVTSAFFREAKVLPMIGRLFLDKEYQIADARVVVIAAPFTNTSICTMAAICSILWYKYAGIPG